MVAWVKALLIVTIITLTFYAIFTPPQTGFAASTEPCNRQIIYNIGIGDNLSTELGSELDRSDLCMFKGDLNIGGTTSNSRELLVFNNRGKFAGAATTLTSSSNYNDIVFEAKPGSIKLYYTFDNNVDLTKVTKNNPAQIQFLGKTFNIFSVSGKQFTAFAGDSKLISGGQLIDVKGKSVRLARVGSNGAIIIEIDGEAGVIEKGGSEFINGLQVTNIDSFYDSSSLENNIAKIVVGTQSLITVSDGGYYSADNQKWRWNIGDLSTTGSTVTSESEEFSGPFIGIENAFDYSSNDDDTPRKGECINLPEDYMHICLDATTTSDTTTVDIEMVSEDFTEAGGTTEQAVHFEADTNNLRVGSTRTREFWITGSGNLYYYDNGIKAGSFDGTNIGRIERLDLVKSGGIYTLKSSQENDNIAFSFSGSDLSTITWNGKSIKDTNGVLITKQGVIVKDVDDDGITLAVPEDRSFATFRLVSAAQ